MPEKILFVDDHTNNLAAYQRNFSDHFSIEIAKDSMAGLQKISNNGPFGVIVSDLAMPGKNGIEFLCRAKELAPDSVCMMLTGHVSLRIAVEALHRGGISQLLVKPFPADRLRVALEAGLAQYRRNQAERNLTEMTLRGNVQILMDILSIVAADIFDQVQVLRQNMRLLAQELQADEVWTLELAGALSNVGFVTMLPPVIERIRAGYPLTDDDQNILRRIPEISYNLLIHIPRLETVAEMILYGDKNFDGTGFPTNAVAGEHIPLGGRMLKVLRDLAAYEGAGLSRMAAFDKMRQHQERYDPDILTAALVCLTSAKGWADEDDSLLHHPFSAWHRKSVSSVAKISARTRKTGINSLL